MKFAHISDLHLGKRLHQFSLIEDQEYILDQMIEIMKEEQVDGVLIAGDVYDKIYPSAEAIALFDKFLVNLSKLKVTVFVISGNHDSPERIAFLGEITKKAGVYFSPVYKGRVEPITLYDEYGECNIYLLPFVKPVHVRHFFPDEKIESYTDAIKVAIDHMEPDFTKRNILVAHQFVIGARRSDSEEVTVGGLDHVEAEVFSDFDYTALGHIHGPQKMKEDKIRYCGTPLKYSFSEEKDEKSMTIVEIKEKGEIKIRTRPFFPKRDLIKIRGKFLEVMNPLNFMGMDPESYLHVTLLDEEDIPEAFYRLAGTYPNIMQMTYERKEKATGINLEADEEQIMKSPIEIFASLYEEMNQHALSEKQIEYLNKKISKIWEGDTDEAN